MKDEQNTDCAVTLLLCVLLLLQMIFLLFFAFA